MQKMFWAKILPNNVVLHCLVKPCEEKNKTTAMKYFYFYISLLYFNFEAIFIRNKLL